MHFDCLFQGILLLYVRINWGKSGKTHRRYLFSGPGIKHEMFQKRRNANHWIATIDVCHMFWPTTEAANNEISQIKIGNILALRIVPTNIINKLLCIHSREQLWNNVQREVASWSLVTLNFGRTCVEIVWGCHVFYMCLENTAHHSLRLLAWKSPYWRQRVWHRGTWFYAVNLRTFYTSLS